MKYFYFYSKYDQKHLETWLMTAQEALAYAKETGWVYCEASLA